jgi:hypothetical protein
MHVEVLVKHIASIPVIQNIPALIKRIADSRLPHGADIIINLYQAVLLRYHPQALALANAPTGSEQLRGSSPLPITAIDVPPTMSPDIPPGRKKNFGRGRNVEHFFLK